MTENLFKKAIAEHSRKSAKKTNSKASSAAKTQKATTPAPTPTTSKLASRITARAAARETSVETETETPSTTPELNLPASTVLAVSPRPLSSKHPTRHNKRGRPATGKRSNQDWIARTIYVRREVDLDVEMELLNLRRQGIAIDKSELIDTLLSGWLNWRLGGDIMPHITTVSPRPGARDRKTTKLT